MEDNIIIYENIKLIKTKDAKLINNIFIDKKSDQYYTYTYSKELYKNNNIYIIKDHSEHTFGIAALYAIDTLNMNACIDVYTNDKNILEMKKAIICLLKHMFDDLKFKKLYSIFSFDNKLYKDFWSDLRFVDGVLLRSHNWTGIKHNHLFTKNILQHEYMRFFKSENNIKKVLNEQT